MPWPKGSQAAFSRRPPGSEIARPRQLRADVGISANVAASTTYSHTPAAVGLGYRPSGKPLHYSLASTRWDFRRIARWQFPSYGKALRSAQTLLGAVLYARP